MRHKDLTRRVFTYKPFPGAQQKGIFLFLVSAHFVLVSNILYLVVLHDDILPAGMRGELAKPLFRAIHGFAYALFLAFCSQKTTAKNQYRRAVTGMQIGAVAAGVLLVLTLLSQTSVITHSSSFGLLSLLYLAALIIGGFGDALATPALLGMIADSGQNNGPKYIGYFWTGISVSYVYIPLLSFWFLSQAKSNPSYRFLPFAFDLTLSLTALVVFPFAHRALEKRKMQLDSVESVNLKKSPSPTLGNLIHTLKSNKFILSFVLILAANQFAFNSLKTASQEFSVPWKDVGLIGNALMFTIFSYLISRFWKQQSTPHGKTRNFVLLALMIIFAVGISVIMLKNSPLVGAGVMLFFGPFSAMLHTGVNIYYAQVVMAQGPTNVGARLGMFSSLYRLVGSVGYLVTVLIVFLHGISKLPKPILTLVINGVPVLSAALFFALLTRKITRK